MNAHFGDSGYQVCGGENRPFPRTTQLSLSLCISETLSLTSPLRALQESLHSGPSIVAPIDSSASLKPGRVGSVGVRKVELVHIPKLLTYGGECLT